ncbi:Alpha/Beta hydrolase protein [Paraphoma chrysanthemicola]|uniref:Alpha/Beta hydrolase protein n=1 Tax=Paraphoma chrysanthemicola TaxID=798071 RepID=A0A8K0RC59_9PLEO|nr:Alpha/Beta hydrolase protein [Paraphoma chrysanthemicola]
MEPLRAALRVPYKTVSNVDIPTDIYLPTASSQPCPALIMIHGGAFMLGSASINNTDQIADCIERGWIVMAIEHRLCPGVNVLEGPMADVRDALAFAQEGGLAKALVETWTGTVDSKRVMVMGTSSGGHLALSTAFNTPHPPLAILDFYGAKHFASPFWTQRMSKMPPAFFEPRPQSEMDALHLEKTTLIGGASLEGQAPDPTAPDPKIRQAFAMHQIATGNVVKTIWPAHPDRLESIDPLLNVSKSWPPVCIVHGTADSMIPMSLSKDLEKRMQEEGLEVTFIEVEGEEHTFAGKMQKGSRTWNTQRQGFDWLEKIVQRSSGS